MKRKWTVTTAALAISAASVLAGGAQASTLIDFTDRTIWSGQNATATTNVNYGSLTVDLSSNPVDRLNFTENFDGLGDTSYCVSGGGDLACVNDGVGVNPPGGSDDEITAVDNDATPPNQSITVEFGKKVNVLSFHFLDLFFQPGEPSTDQERALVYANGDITDTRTFVAISAPGVNGGYFKALNPFGDLNLTSLTFFADVGNDGQGNPDYALAAIDVQVVPLPAAVWLLLAGLGSLGALRLVRKT